MDAQGGGTSDGTQIQEWPCNGTGSQSFELESDGSGGFYILNTQANKCVDVQGAGTANGTKIQLYDCNGTPAQTFTTEDAGNGFVSIVNTHSNKCLDVTADDPAAGTVVQLYDCNQTHAQTWNPSVIGVASGSSSSGSSSGSTSGGGSGSSSGGSTCDASAWVYLGTNANACDGNLGESCGWTATNEGQGYTCQTVSWGTGCEPGGTVCPGGGSGSGSGSGGSSSGGTSSGGGVASILSESTFDSFFPNRLAIYTYDGLVAAAQTYAAFGTTGSSDDQKREVAAFLANVAHETGGLQYVNEIQQAAYCSPTADCPCAAGQEYFGRGALQLSWNYNYCAAGQAFGQDLVDNPGLVATNPTLAWGTGVWFWMTSTGANGLTCHAGIASSGFGATISTINGGIECNGGDPSEVQDRVQYYNTFCAALGVSPGSNETC
jgi:chitinase